MQRVARAVRLLLLALGLGLAVYLVYRHAGEIALSLGQVGWRILPYLAASFLVYALDALGWRHAFLLGQPVPGFGRLFGIRMAGEAVNKVTPLASLGGEPLKAYLLARHGSTTADALASVAIAKNSLTLAGITFIFAGLALAWERLPQHRAALLGFGAFPAFVLLSLAGIAALDLLLRRRRRSAAAASGAGSSFIPHPSSFPTALQAVVGVWALFADYFRSRPGAFLASFLCFFLGWAAGALEMLAGAWALGIDLSPRDAFIMEALLTSVNMATFLVPANMGTQEGGFAVSAQWMGLTAPQGVALAVLRRCRDVLWIGYGLLYLTWTEGKLVLQPPVEGMAAAGGGMAANERE